MQGDPVAIQGVSGLGGQLGPALLQQTSLEDQLAQLGAGPLAAALAAAGSQAGAGNSSAMLSLEEQVASRLGELLAVSQAQYSVLSQLQLPPFGGSFLTGGMVPGPLGAARTVIAHGGETITPVGGSSGDTYVHIDRKSDLAKLIDVRIEKHDRSTALRAGRRLPGRGGGTARTMSATGSSRGALPATLTIARNPRTTASGEETPNPLQTEGIRRLWCLLGL